PPALHREDDADGEAADAHEEEALAPDLVHLVEQLFELERPPPEPPEELADEGEERAGIVEEAVEHALRVAEALDGLLGEALLAEDLLVGAAPAHLAHPLGERAVARRGLGGRVLVGGLGRRHGHGGGGAVIYGAGGQGSALSTRTRPGGRPPRPGRWSAPGAA